MPRFMKAGIVDRKSYPDQLSRDFDVMWTRSLEEPAVLDQFFVTMDESEGDNFKISNIGANLDMPIANEDTEKLPYTQVAPGLSKTLTYVPYRMGVRATDTQRAMERYAKLSSMVSGLPAASMSKLEYLRVAIFDNSFSGTAGADDLPLCSNSHPHENIEYGAWDNLGTGPASVGNLHAQRQLALKMTNEWGRPMPVDIRDWLIPTDLDQTFEEIKVAKQDPETALNTPNVLINNRGYVCSRHLSSTTAYWGFADLTGEARGIFEVFLQRPNVKNNNPENVDIIFDKRIKFIVAHGFATSKNVFGSAGS